MRRRRLSLRKLNVQTADVRQVPSHNCQLNVQNDPSTYRIFQGGFIQIRRRLWKFMTVNGSSPESKKYIKSAALIWEEETRHLDNYKNVIHPFSQFRFMWQTFMMLVWLMLLFWIPISVMSSRFRTKALMAKTILDFTCIVDIVLRFFTGYYDNKKQTVVLKLKKIAKHYLLTFFFVDLVSSVPTQLWLMGTNGKDLHNFIGLLLIKLIRVPTMLKYFRLFSERTNFCASNVKFVSFTVWMAVLLSWSVSVVYMLIVVLDLTFLLTLANTNYSALVTGFRVVRMLMGIGTTTPMNASNAVMICQIGFVVLGAFVEIIIIAKVMQFYQKRSTSINKYNSLREEISQYINYKELPARLRHKIMKYLDFKFRNHIFREEDILGNLSSVLKHDILMERCQDMIEKVEFFKDLPPEVILRIVTKLRSEIFLPNDAIVVAGYTGNAMYFIYMGTVAVYAPNGKEVCHLEEGGHFGEIALMLNEPRVATVVAAKECELFRLSRREFQEAIEPFPELNKKIRDTAVARMEDTLRLMSDPSSVLP